MQNTHIAWTDNTYNPIRMKGGMFYCFKVSAGCTHCYAEVMNKRIVGMQNAKIQDPDKHLIATDYANMKEYPEMELLQGMLDGWKHKKKACKNFVSSMTDVFGEFVPDDFVFKILDAMVAADRQIFQVLTKRSKRMKELVNKYCDLRGLYRLPNNIWLIVSVENQETLSRAIDLIATKCVIRGLSMEPLLDAVNLCLPQQISVLDGNDALSIEGDRKIIDHIDWVIVGGESGHKARIMNPFWAYNIKRQCEIYRVPFFFKQWGEWVPAKFHAAKGKAILEDGGIFWTNPGHPKIYDWKEKWDGDDSYYHVVSARVGKAERELNWMGEVKVTLSDNALLGGKHYFQFPKYLDNVVTTT